MSQRRKPTRQQQPQKNEPVKKNDDATQKDDASPPNEADDIEPPATAVDASEPSGKKQVRWAKPAKNWMHWRTYSKWAPILFQRPWEELDRKTIASFDRPHLPSPLHQEETVQKKKKPVRSRYDSEDLSSLYDNVRERIGDYLADIENEDAGLLCIGRGYPIPLEGAYLDGELKV